MSVVFSEEIPAGTKGPYVESVTGTVISSTINYPYLLLETSEVSGSLFVVPQITLNDVCTVSPAFYTTYNETAAAKICEFDDSAEPVGVLSGSAAEGQKPIQNVILQYYPSPDVVIPENKIAAVYQIDSAGNITPLNLEEENAYTAETYTLSTYVFAFVTPVILTYDANGAASGSVPALSRLPAHSTVTVADEPDDLVKSGYTFTGWNTKADGTGTHYAAGSTFIIEEDTTLYALWKVNKTTATASDEGTAEFGNDNVTAVKKEGGSKLSSICLESVSGVTETVTFTADLVVDESGIPAQVGMNRIVVSVFDVNAALLASGTKASFKVTIELANPTEKENVVFWHFKDNQWVKLHSSIVTENNKKITYKVETDSFSPFAITIESEIPQLSHSSSRDYGASVWLPATAEPTPLYSSEKIIIKIDESRISVSDLPKEYEYTSLGGLGLYSAAIPAGKSVDEAIRFFTGLDGVLYAEPDGYVYIESTISDTEPVETPASPAPLAAVLAGLGAAGVLFELRRK